MTLRPASGPPFACFFSFCSGSPWSSFACGKTLQNQRLQCNVITLHMQGTCGADSGGWSENHPAGGGQFWEKVACYIRATAWVQLCCAKTAIVLDRIACERLGGRLLLRCACGQVRLMRWVRTNRRWGTWLALAAMALQLVLSFGHIHLEKLASGSAIASMAASKAPSSQQNPVSASRE